MEQALDGGAWQSMMWRSKAMSLASVQSGGAMEFLEQMGVHEGVEMVHPYLDREMVSFAFRTPPELIGTLMRWKRLFASALAARFPGVLDERPKTASRNNFVANELRKAREVVGPRGRWRLEEVVPLDSRCRDLIARMGAGEEPSSPPLAWYLFCEELWLRRHFPAEGLAAG